MAKNVARFEKVSFAQFKKTLCDLYPNRDFEDDEIQMMYDTIELPTRATFGSLGYDFVTPFDFTLTPATKIAIPTGIRAVFLKDEWGLLMMPKSRNVKNSIRLSNTIGVIDTDYYLADNSGHIIIYLEMPSIMDRSSHITKFRTIMDKSFKPFHYNAGDSIVQGIFVEIGLVEDDSDIDKTDRTGGFGSTDENKETSAGESTDNSSTSTDSTDGDSNSENTVTEDDITEMLGD